MSGAKKNKTLYICYFGLREPLVQTQVLPYLREIAKLEGLEIGLLTFEPDFKKKWNAEQIEAEKNALAADGIDWHALPYHKWPSLPATLYDVMRGALFTRKMIAQGGVSIVHARIHVPMLMAVLARKLSGRKAKLLFDIRGFFPEEYTEGGRWKKDGAVFKAVKKVERWLLREADAFVVLTEKARDILFPGSRETGIYKSGDKNGRPVEVIPCCVDLKRFAAAGDASRSEIRAQYDLNGRKVFVYIGALGTWYLLDEMADLFQAAREEDKTAFAMILTQSPPEMMSERLKSRGFSGGDMMIQKVSPAEIPAYLSAADVAISFIKPCFSKLSSSPTKMAEYLAAGLPVITNGGVGDVAEQVEGDKTGSVVADFSPESYLKSLQDIEILRQTGALEENCRKSAKNRFDLEKIGGEKYRSIYRKLAELPKMAATE
jgi:glycosyltransferase involved in cell wall biosynthesis